jgi:hypothetical protein
MARGATNRQLAVRQLEAEAERLEQVSERRDRASDPSGAARAAVGAQAARRAARQLNRRDRSAVQVRRGPESPHDESNPGRAAVVHTVSEGDG